MQSCQYGTSPTGNAITLILSVLWKVTFEHFSSSASIWTPNLKTPASFWKLQDLCWKQVRVRLSSLCRQGKYDICPGLCSSHNYGLVVRIRRSHRRGPGSIPGVGTFPFFSIIFDIPQSVVCCSGWLPLVFLQADNLSYLPTAFLHCHVSCLLPAAQLCSVSSCARVFLCVLLRFRFKVNPLLHRILRDGHDSVVCWQQ